MACTNETKLVAFQFKLIHNILNNNSNLFKWGIKQNNACELCDDHYVDNTVHALASCAWTKQKVLDISVELGLRDTFAQITKKEFIFGTEDTCMNNIILLIKYLLHSARQNNGYISPAIVRNEIYKRVFSDKKSMSTYKFAEKWTNHGVLVQKAIDYMQNLNI